MGNWKGSGRVAHLLAESGNESWLADGPSRNALRMLGNEMCRKKVLNTNWDDELLNATKQRNVCLILESTW
jgi:hypothetical protein